MAKKFEISNNIRKLRFFANEMTQQVLAEKAGVSRQTIIAIEAGKYSPLWSLLSVSHLSLVCKSAKSLSVK